MPLTSSAAAARRGIQTGSPVNGSSPPVEAVPPVVPPVPTVVPPEIPPLPGVVGPPVVVVGPPLSVVGPPVSVVGPPVSVVGPPVVGVVVVVVADPRQCDSLSVAPSSPAHVAEASVFASTAPGVEASRDPLPPEGPFFDIG